MKTYHVTAEFLGKDGKLVRLDDSFQSEHEGMDNIEAHQDIVQVLKLFLGTVKERKAHQIAIDEWFMVRYSGETTQKTEE